MLSNCVNYCKHSNFFLDCLDLYLVKCFLPEEVKLLIFGYFVIL